MIGRRTGLVVFVAALTLAVAAYAGPRSGLLILIGFGFGVVLEGLRFGFAGPWRAMIVEGDARGLNAQLLAIGLTASAALPLLAMAPGELSGAHGPVGYAMVGGAFVFGIAMQMVFGCGSGTLVNAGSGNLVGAVALPGFVAGSFFGTLHLAWWTDLGSLPVITLQGVLGTSGGLAATLAGLAAIAGACALRAGPGRRAPSRRLVLAAVLIALLAVCNLVVSGQPWGVVYGLGLWGAKIAQGLGADAGAWAYWSLPGNAVRLHESVLLDITSLTNFGLIAGAFVAMRWRVETAPQTARLRPSGWLVVLVAGLALGYSSRLAFGCNVGAFFSGIATGSLHGWIWLPSAFLGAALGIRLRSILVVGHGRPAMAGSPA